MLQQDRSCQGCLVSPWDPLKPGLWGRGGHRVLSWGWPGAAPQCPQRVENSVKWTQEPAQSPCRGLRSQQPALGNSRHQTRPCLVLRKQGGLRPSPVCRGAPRDGRSRNRGTASLEWSDRGSPPHGCERASASRQPRLKPRVAGQVQGPVLRAGCQA